MLGRATAGTYRGKVVFSTPVHNAVQLANRKVNSAGINHLAWEIARQS